MAYHRAAPQAHVSHEPTERARQHLRIFYSYAPLLRMFRVFAPLSAAAAAHCARHYLLAHFLNLRWRRLVDIELGVICRRVVYAMA